MANAVLKSRLYTFSCACKYKKSKLILHLKPDLKLSCKRGLLHLFLGTAKAQKCYLLILHLIKRNLGKLRTLAALQCRSKRCLKFQIPQELENQGY